MGLAVGDALGTTLEFSSPGTFEPITDMIGGGPFGLEPGQWTDDTSMALCLAESLIKNGFDAKDQMYRYRRWHAEGYLSSTGECFDIGGTTRRSLDQFEATGEPYCGLKSGLYSGNGSIMRLAPIPMFFANDPAIMSYAANSSRTTHGSPQTIDACKYLSALIVGALLETDKQTMLSPSFGDIWCGILTTEIDVIKEGSFKDKEPPDIVGLGYVVKTLEAALWAFDRSNSFEEGCLMAVNLGDDADTTGAVYGQLAGTYYGIDGIPEKWVEKIAKKELILEYADKLLGE